MINGISRIYNYNLYNNKTLKKTNRPAAKETSFQGNKTNLIKKLPSTISGFSSLATINNNIFKDYFFEIGRIPTYIYVNEKPLINPEFDKYIEKLDNLTLKEKKQFVKTFCKITGFPNLKDVQTNIDNEIKRAIDVCFKDSDAKPLFASYDSCSSAGKGFALPGSDCDGLFIVMDKAFGKNIPHRWNIGNEINQRLINTQGAHYPELFAIEELMKYIDMADKIFEKIKTQEKIEIYKKNLMMSNQNYIKAGEFNLDIESKITTSRDKDMMYLTAMFAEEVRSGHIIINKLSQEDLRIIKNSALYKYSNIVRQEGFQNNIKPKWENRIKMAAEFDSKSDDEKFEICCSILKSTMGLHQQNQNNIYANFDMGNIIDLIDKLTSWGKYLK